VKKVKPSFIHSNREDALQASIDEIPENPPPGYMTEQPPPPEFGPGTPRIGPSLAAEAARLDAEILGAAAHDDTAAEAEAAAPVVPSHELIRPLLAFAFDVYAPRWKVLPAEVDKLAEAYGAVVDKYFPDGLFGQYAVEINAVLITVAVFQPRMNIRPRDDVSPEDKSTPNERSVSSEKTPAADGWGLASSVL
jgi:hypothetical protein